MSRPASGPFTLTRVDLPRIASWLARESRLDSFTPETGMLAFIGDMEIGYLLYEIDDGFEIWFRDRGHERRRARASHLDDAIRYLAVEILHMSSGAALPQLTRADVDQRFAFIDSPDAITVDWTVDGVQHTLRIEESRLTRENRAARFARCADASLGKIAAALRTPGGAPC